MHRYWIYSFTLLLCATLSLSACLTKKQAIIKNSKASLTVEITTDLGDAQEYIEGDDISFLVSISKDAYLLIVYLDAAQRLWQLLPNDYDQQSKFKAGIYIPIPRAQQSYRFRASAPFGKESLTVFASNAPFPKLPNTLFRNGLSLLELSIDELEKKLRALKSKNANTLETSSLTISTRQRP